MGASTGSRSLGVETRTRSGLQDISGADLSPASSAPVSGWASWLNGAAVLLLYYSNDMGIEGWARVPGVAPTEDDPKSWVELARAIVAAIAEDYTYRPGMSGQRFLLRPSVALAVATNNSRGARLMSGSEERAPARNRNLREIPRPWGAAMGRRPRLAGDR